MAGGIGSFMGGKCMPFCAAHSDKPTNLLEYLPCLQVSYLSVSQPIYILRCSESFVTASEATRRLTPTSSETDLPPRVPSHPPFLTLSGFDIRLSLFINENTGSKTIVE